MVDSKNILIVDDSDDLSHVIADFLSMFGYRVHTAKDGLAALEYLEKTSMDIVVSDIHMPKMDGFTLMTEIKSRYPRTPIILITGFSVSEAKKMAFEKGADAFVAKPFHLKDLKNVIDSVIQS
ncbi:MAG: Sensor histidine kinase RcsC [Deltaproteobacteria bacterium ADurb.BinA179]|jgi:CheY-like chemotaxis protein|nr:response regulator [Deltaproteobacteria bacterium]MDI9541612.1 response regulator [Pseudomonadota bacterium]NLW68737.1 response regulator [Bacteriovoracaceae bacterium]OPZ26958.1 MAG: Sensor histidine kinase RcsC [Deltaproteobacteria bacterium ADurb.BinA179]HRR20120.1 response regulator [Desulfomonilia bacterium]